MITPHQILEEYFGFIDFRQAQLEIIQSVLAKKDTLALLPTGGGKSICFQVPALMQDGICIVVTPLISLMKDQVSQLKKRDIKAAAIFSSLSYREIDTILDNCQFGYYKFLYVSPERLKTELFIERFKRMNVNLIAVDEAHCVSQWGYDFRPSYLEIANIRQYHAHVPMLALTASATIEVQNDIIAKLNFKNNSVFKKTFKRDNIRFVSRHETAKLPKLIEILQKIIGSAIVYVRNRNKTKEVAEYLSKFNIAADFYHAGLSAIERNKKQDDWINNKINVIVCTNAFGMGIDKADVRVVVHLDVPESIEAYYQEAGRAGRDGKTSYAVLLYNSQDIEKLNESLLEKFPAIVDVKRVYNALCNHFELAVESGRMQTFKFDINYFSQQFNLSPSLIYNSLKLLEQENYLQLSENDWMPSRATFIVDQNELYRYEVAHATHTNLIRMMLRTYGGILNHYIKINEARLAKQLNCTENEIKQHLIAMHKNNILVYVCASELPTILFLNERLHDNNLYFNVNYIQQRKKIIQEQIQAIIRLTEETVTCRQVIICTYFGENNIENCGVCDNCIKEKKEREAKHTFELIKQDILNKTKNNWVQSEEILPSEAHFSAQQYKDVIRFLLDENILQLNDKNELKSV